MHQRAAAGVPLCAEAEVPKRPHKEVRQCTSTGEEGIFLKFDLYSAILCFDAANVDSPDLGCL